MTKVLAAEVIGGEAIGAVIQRRVGASGADNGVVTRGGNGAAREALPGADEVGADPNLAEPAGPKPKCGT